MNNSTNSSAMDLLQRKNILDVIARDMGELGFVGEENNKKLGFLIAVSRKLADPLSGVIISGSSAGKSGLVEIIEKLIPKEEVISLSNLTSQALYYMPKDYLKHKLLIVEERKGSELSDYSIRVLQSKKKLIHASALRDKQSGEIHTRLIEVEGPVSILETTTSSSINPENASRVFELYLDESQEQTLRIHQFQKHTKSIDWLEGKRRQERIIKKHHELQKLLLPIHIVNPFADKIQFPAHIVRTRRDHLRFLNLIEVITFLHQYQRERKKHGGIEYIESTVEDYNIAYLLMKGVMMQCMDNLHKPSRELYQKIQQMSNGRQEFTKREIAKYMHWPIYKVRDHIYQLIDYGYVEALRKANGKSTTYKILRGKPRSILLREERDALSSPQPAYLAYRHGQAGKLRGVARRAPL